MSQSQIIILDETVNYFLKLFLSVMKNFVFQGLRHLMFVEKSLEEPNPRQGLDIASTKTGASSSLRKACISDAGWRLVGLCSHCLKN